MPKPWEISGFLDIKENHLHIDGTDAVDLVRRFGSPLFVFSESRIRHNIARLKRVASVIDRPLKLCYAGKAASTMGILRAVRDAECDLEVNSGGELWKGLKAGFRGDQIIFNGTSKEIWEIEMAVEASIYAIQVDSLYELSLISDTAKRLGKTANVSLRLVPEIETNTHSGLQTALLTSKFGMMPDEAFAAFREYKDSPELNLAGIHLHIGSQNPDPEVYTEALEKLFEAMIRIHAESGVKLRHVNLGGGFPVNYSRGNTYPEPPERVRKEMEDMLEKGYIESNHPDGRVTRSPIPKQWVESAAREKMFAADYEPESAIAEAWKHLRAKALETAAEDLLDDLTILLEPGRSIIADAGICVTTVRNIKDRPLANINHSIKDAATAKLEADKKKRSENDLNLSFGMYATEFSFTDTSITSEHWLLTDAGFNLLLSMETYKWYYHLISAERADADHNFPYKVAGPLCDGGDVYFDIEGEGRLPDHRLLPKNIEPGEVLALLNCGAYSFSQASEYNGRPLPAIVLIKSDGTPELIRKRDSLEDLIRNDIDET
jgi:diaminopimelate decarboxylase